MLLIELLERGVTIIASNAYCKTLKKLRRAIQKKCGGMLSSEIVLALTLLIHLLTLLRNLDWMFLAIHPTAQTSRQLTTIYFFS